MPELPHFGPQVLMPAFWQFPLLDLADRQGDVLAIREDVQLPRPFHQSVGDPSTSPLWAVWALPLAAP